MHGIHAKKKDIIILARHDSREELYHVVRVVFFGEEKVKTV